MTRENPTYTPENKPATLDLLSAEWENIFLKKAALYRRKIQPLLKADRVLEPCTVKTILPNETLESSVEAQPGDWIIVGAENEKFVLTSEKFNHLYTLDVNGNYLPHERKILAIKNPHKKPIRIHASWSTADNPSYQEGDQNCFLVASVDSAHNLTKDRYIIGDETLLLSNYELVQ